MTPDDQPQAQPPQEEEATLDTRQPELNSAEQQAAWEKVQEQRRALRDQKTADHKAALEAQRMEQFKQQVHEFISRASPEQRAILQLELDKTEMARTGLVWPTAGVARDPHAELQAREAGKVEAMRLDVGKPIPAPAPHPDALANSQYEKVGEQWRLCLGSVAGQMQYRWLSMEDARALGLEPEVLPVPLGNDERINWDNETDPALTRSPLDQQKEDGA